MKDQILREEITHILDISYAAGSLNEKDIIAALRAEGITTLEQLVSNTLLRLREGCPTRAPVIGVEECKQGLPITHTAPQIPVTVNGVEYEPADIARFDGTPLHFIYSRRSDGRTLFQGTSDRSQVNTVSLIWSFLQIRDWKPIPVPVGSGGTIIGIGQEHGPESSSGTPPPKKERNYGSVQMFSDANYEGDWFWLDRGYQYAKLSKVSRNTVLFFSGDWNDQISSISETAGPVTYFEHADFQGSSLTVPPWAPIPNLTWLGWNDRISSVRYPYFFV